MPTGKSGFEYIIAAKDDLSGFVEAKALMNLKSATIFSFLKSYFGRFGYPKTLVGDQGELAAKEVQEYVKSLGIKLIFSSTYHPQGNAVVKRGHQEIISSLQKWIAARSDTIKKGLWPDYLPYAVLASNLTVKRTTGFTPF